MESNSYFEYLKEATEEAKREPVNVEYLPGALGENDRVWFQRVNPGYEVTSDLLKISTGRESTTHIIVKGKMTPYCMVRDCGDHFIRALTDRYQRIDKATLQITDNVKDI